MSDSTDVSKAVGSLLELMGIGRCVYVDDRFALAAVEEAIGFLKILVQVDRNGLASELAEVEFEAPEEVWEAQVREIWAKLPDDRKEHILGDIMKSCPEEETTQYGLDIAAASALETMMNNLLKNEYLELSLGEWCRRQGTLLQEAGTVKTLFLFDLDFRNESAIDGGETTGLKLLRTVHDTTGLDTTAVCGLISHKITKEQEYEEWERLAQAEGLDRDRFVIVSKLRLSEEDLEGFAWMLKLMFLNKPCKELKDQASRVLKEAVGKAYQEIDEIRVYAFEHIVLRSSAIEGVWEPDTLFRLFEVFRRKATHESAHIDPEIRQTVSLLRGISKIPITPNEDHRTYTWRIRQEELYESGDSLNRYHIPIDLGDVFQKTNGKAQFVLVGRPCDLMVRGEGERAGKRSRDMNQVFLVRIKKKIPAQNQSSEQEPSSEKDPFVSEKVVELEYFHEDDGSLWYIDLADAHVTNLLTLDMCVFNTEGEARFSPGENCPEDVIPSWKLRHERIKKEVVRILNDFSRLREKKVKDCLATRLACPPATYGKTVFTRSISPEADGVTYGVKRIARVCQPKATDVLQRFMHFHTRAGFDHDFGRK